MTLEQQIDKLAELGLRLNEGITIDDFLYSADREEYENEPFGLILFTYGVEVERKPWDRLFCDRVWNFDVECICDDGSYVTIVENLCRVAGMPDLAVDVKDHVDIESGVAWLEYTMGGNKRHLDIPVNDDWADPDTVTKLMEDIQRDGKHFFGINNGQASILFYLDENTATQLNVLSRDALTRMV